MKARGRGGDDERVKMLSGKIRKGKKEEAKRGRGGVDITAKNG